MTQLEKQLKAEEKKLEEINLELKGKTDGFLKQIEAHQKELAPWTEKINEKKKAIDVKQSEREILEEKITSGERAVEAAQLQLQKIQEMLQRKQKEMDTLPDEINALQKEIADLETKFAVCSKLYQSMGRAR